MSKIQDGDVIVQAIQAAIADEVRRQIEVEAEAAAERVRAALQRSAGNIAVAVLSSYTIERMGPELVIRVKIGNGNV